MARYSWGFVGMALALAIAVVTLGTVRNLVVPLIVAAFFAIVAEPVVTWLADRGLARGLAAMLVVVAIIAVVAGAAVVVVVGIVDQTPEVSARLGDGRDRITEWLEDSKLGDAVASVFDTGGSQLGSGMGGLASQIGSFVSSAAGLATGLLLGLIFMFYLLRDGAQAVDTWLTNRRPENREQYDRILSQAAASLRAYVRGRSILAVVQGVFIAVAMAVLGVPLAFSIGVVNFVGAFIPYLGGVLGGAFAVVIALSDGGLTVALIALGVILFTNIVLENLLEPRLLGSSLDLHPILVLISTVAGGTIAGILGVTLAAPLTSIGIYLFGELRRSGFFSSPGGGTDAALDTAEQS